MFVEFKGMNAFVFHNQNYFSTSKTANVSNKPANCYTPSCILKDFFISIFSVFPKVSQFSYQKMLLE